MSTPTKELQISGYIPPPYEHLSVDSQERYAILEPYWRKVPMHLFAIHLEGMRKHAHNVRNSYPLYQKEVKRAQAIYNSRL